MVLTKAKKRIGPEATNALFKLIVPGFLFYVFVVSNKNAH